MEDLIAGAKAVSSGIVEVEASLDGVPLQGLRNFFLLTPIFSFTAPTDPAEAFDATYLGVQEKTVAYGYYIMLEPLAVGQHTLTWRAKEVYPAGSDMLVIERRRIWHLNVQ